MLAIFLSLAFSSVDSWDYFEGGDDWTGICASGKQQSPINLKDSIVTKIDDSTMTVTLDLIGTFSGQFTKLASGALSSNGQFGYITTGSVNISLVNMHYHAPSEHTINGNYYDMEFHFYGTDQNSRTNEFAIFLTAIETSNKFVKASIDSYEQGTSQSLDFSYLVPNGVIDNFYYYNGSLSAPFDDCYENVGFIVLADPVEISEEQLDYFNSMWKNNETYAGGRGNNRKVQALNGRQVYFHSDSFGALYRLSVVLFVILA